MLEPVMEGPRADSPGQLMRQLAGSLSQDTAETRSLNAKTSKPLRKAHVLGWETRNVNKQWLEPVALMTRSQDRQHAATTEELLGAREQLHPTYGPGQNSPQDLAALRATRMIGQLGRTAIYSNSPYVENVFETLVQHGSPYAVEPRRTGGRVPRQGSKAAAVRRAKRVISQVTPFRSEVPFGDAVRVAALYNDRTAVPALLDAYITSKPRISGATLEQYSQVLAQQTPATQLQAVAILVQEGYYFTAVKVVYADRELLKATLDEMKLIVSQHMEEENWQAALQAWNWKEADKELFVTQFSELRIIAYYKDVRRQLQALRTQGVAPLVRVEREMLIKVIDDFYTQVEEAANAQGGELKPEISGTSSSRMKNESSVASVKAQKRAEVEARAEAERQRQAEVKQKVKEERERREAAAAEARARAKEDLDAKRADRSAATAAAVEAAQKQQQEQEQAAEAARLAKLTAKQAAAEVAKRQQEEAKALAEVQRQAKLQSKAAAMEAARKQQEELRLAAEAQRQQRAVAAAAANTSGKDNSYSIPVVVPGGPLQDILESPEEDVSQTEPTPAQAEILELAANASVADQDAPQVEVKPDSTAHESEDAAPEKPTATEPTAADVAPEDSTSQPEGGAPAPVEPAPEAQELQPAEPALDAAEQPQAEVVPQEEPSPLPAAQIPEPEPSMIGIIAETINNQPQQPATDMPAVPEGAPVDLAATEAPVEPVELDVQPASPKPASQPGSPKPSSPMPGSPTVASPRVSSRQVSVTGSPRPGAGSPKPPSQSVSRQGSQRNTPSVAEAVPGSPARSRSSLPLSGALSDRGSRAGVVDGLAELRKAGSLARQQSEAAAAAARMGQSSLQASRMSTPRSAKELASALEAAHAAAKASEGAERIQINDMFNEHGNADDFEAQKARLAAEMAEEEALAAQMAKKAAEVALLEQARQQLESARSSEFSATPTRPLTPEEKKMVAVVDAQLAGVEEKLKAEREALAVLEAQKRKHEEEKRALNEQLARTMQLFQEQLAHTVKMAAMLQAQHIMTGSRAADVPQLPQVPLPQEVDEPPTEDEIRDYGIYLGMDVVNDVDLLYIAEWALTAPVPEGWTVHLDSEGHEFFYNAASNKSSYEHPMDEHYKEYYMKKKREKYQKPASTVHAPQPKALRV